MLSVPISRFLLLRPWLLLGSSQIFLLKHLPYFCPEADTKGKTLPCWTRECWPHDKTPKEITDIKNNPIEVCGLVFWRRETRSHMYLREEYYRRPPGGQPVRVEMHNQGCCTISLCSDSQTHDECSYPSCHFANAWAIF